MISEPYLRGFGVHVHNRNYNRTFFNAPQSVTSFVAAFMEPLITVVSLLVHGFISTSLCCVHPWHCACWYLR